MRQVSRVRIVKIASRVSLRVSTSSTIRRYAPHHPRVTGDYSGTGSQHQMVMVYWMNETCTTSARVTIIPIRPRVSLYSSIRILQHLQVLIRLVMSTRHGRPDTPTLVRVITVHVPSIKHLVRVRPSDVRRRHALTKDVHRRHLLSRKHKSSVTGIVRTAKTARLDVANHHRHSYLSVRTMIFISTTMLTTGQSIISPAHLSIAVPPNVEIKMTTCTYRLV